jgi:hypothetical protein
MALLEIAVSGLTLAPQGIVSGGVLTITSTPSTKVKCESKGIYGGTLQFTLAGANATGYDPGTVTTVGTATITTTATKDKVGGQFVMRKNDQNLVVSMTGTISGTPTPFVEPWKITAAGQTTIKGQ